LTQAAPDRFTVRDRAVSAPQLGYCPRDLGRARRRHLPAAPERASR
jgi:hypothetical protein